MAVFIGGTLALNTFNLLKVEKSIEGYQVKLNDPAIQEKVQEANKVSAELDILSRYEKDLTSIYKGVESRDVVSNEILNMMS